MYEEHCISPWFLCHITSSVNRQFIQFLKAIKIDEKSVNTEYNDREENYDFLKNNCKENKQNDREISFRLFYYNFENELDLLEKTDDRVFLEKIIFFPMEVE